MRMLTLIAALTAILILTPRVSPLVFDGPFPEPPSPTGGK